MTEKIVDWDVKNHIKQNKTYHHLMAHQTPTAGTDIYKSSYFPQTIGDWNAPLESVISSTEIADDCVTKFTSLIRGEFNNASALGRSLY